MHQSPVANPPRKISVASSTGDYTTDLRIAGIKYTEQHPFLYGGNRRRSGGWILYLSVILDDIQPLLKMILPFVIKHKLAFRIPKNRDLASALLNGELGPTFIGQVMAIFPAEDADALPIAKQLIELTTALRGPAVPVARHLGSVVYTRYGCFNPVVIPGPGGDPAEYFHDPMGNLVLDDPSMPYKPVQFARWPFDSIATPKPPKRPKYLKNKYGTYLVIKDDVKGFVAKGANMRRLDRWWMLIKEGKKHMNRDQSGRDIFDRLEWQYKIQRKLQPTVRVPRVYDLFYQLDNCYLVMKFVNGPSLDEYVVRLAGYNAWFAVPQKKQLRIMDLAIEMAELVHRLHEAGYIHRDLSTGNFVVHGKKRHLYLIDFENAYSIKEDYPLPAFKGGTFGFMSPEQRALAVPTIQEDIYAVGASLLTIFTLQHPGKFDIKDPKRLAQNIYHFTREPLLSDLIARCLSIAPDDRPSLPKVIETLHRSRETIAETHEEKSTPVTGSTPDQVRDTIQAAIDALGTTAILENAPVWTTVQDEGQTSVGNARFDRQPRPGLQQGTAGILYILAKAKAAGYSIQMPTPALSRSMQHLVKNDLDEQLLPTIPPGLFTGLAGIALSLRHGLEAKVLASKEEYLQVIKTASVLKTEDPSLSNGLAGIGILLLTQHRAKDQKTYSKQLKAIVTQLVKAQGKNGSWTTFDPDGKRQRIASFSCGTAGIAYFLGCYLELAADNEAHEALRKALTWLDKKRNYRQSFLDRLLNGRRLVNFSLSNGVAGIALAFIQAYRATGDEAHKSKAMHLLKQIPEFFNEPDLTTATGITGIGEVYLEATRAFKSGYWQYKAQWIAEMLIHEKIVAPDGSVYWLPGKTEITSPALLSGQSGIIHFLMRYHAPDKTSPLFY